MTGVNRPSRSLLPPGPRGRWVRPPRDLVSLHAPIAAPTDQTALCASLAIAGDVTAAPEWVHLLPAGIIETVDGRGPYRADDLGAIAAHSLPAGERLVIDENHATDLAAPRGEAAPARGWIVALQARADGLWGKVEWTPEGKALVETRAYRAISPVIEHDKTGRVLAVRRASLVNRANLKNLTTLHQESDMTLLQKLIKALGLDETTSEDVLVSTVTSLHQAQAAHQTALQSIGGAAGLENVNAQPPTVEAIVEAIGALTQKSDSKSITALQAEISELTKQLNGEREARLKREAEAFVDGAIKEGRVGVKPLRDHYITRHMADPQAVEKEIAALPKLAGTRIVPAADPKGGEISLNAEQLAVAKMLGLDPKDVAATIKAEREAEEAAL